MTTEKNGWKMTPEQLQKACAKKTKILILNNACNPTGTLYSKKEINDLLKIAKKNNLMVISDEVYSGIVFDNKKFISCASFPKFRKQVIVIQSCSKNFAMTGWRVGFVCAEVRIISQLKNLLSQSTSGVTTISQWAALAAIKNHRKIILIIKNEMETRRDLLVQLMKENFNVTLTAPASSLYFLINLKDLGVKNENSDTFCLRILKKSGVVIVPGSAFGKEGFIRLSFGAKPEVISKAIRAVKACM